MTVSLELADYLLSAERALGLPAEAIASFDRIGLADSALAAPQAGPGGVEAYTEFETQVAVLCWHLVKNHPLPDGNKRCAFLATVEFVERIGKVVGGAPGGTGGDRSGHPRRRERARSAKPTSGTGSRRAAVDGNAWSLSGPLSGPLWVLSHVSHASPGCTA